MTKVRNMTPAQVLHAFTQGHLNSGLIEKWNSFTVDERAALNHGSGTLYRHLERLLPTDLAVSENLSIVPNDSKAAEKWGLHIPQGPKPGPAAIEGAGKAGSGVAAGLRNWPHTHRGR